MYHHSESMVYMLEDMQRNANHMEKEVKMMLEMEGRAYGIELDRRKNARVLMEELQAHIAASESNDAGMTWAYIPEDNCTYDCAEPEDYMPYEQPYYPEDMIIEQTHAPADPNMHMHDDGMEHSHEGGEMPHTHDEDDGAPSSVEPQQ